MLSVPSLYAACSTVNCCYYCSGTLRDMHGSACRAYPSSHADSDTAELVSFLRLRASLPAGFENSSLCCECSKPQTKQLSAICIKQILLQGSDQTHAVPCSAVFASPPPCTSAPTHAHAVLDCMHAKLVLTWNIKAHIAPCARLLRLAWSRSRQPRLKVKLV